MKNLTGDTDSIEAAIGALEDIWNYHLFPQLEELFHGRIEQLVTVLDLEASADTPIEIEHPTAAMEEHGAVPYLSQGIASGDRLIKFLRELAQVKIAETGLPETQEESGTEAETEQ